MEQSDSAHSKVLDRIKAGASDGIWSAADFADLGSRVAIDKTLQRLTRDGDLQRVARGLYQLRRINPITKKPNPPSYAQVLAALSRRDSTPMLVDGMTAANDLGLTTAVPAKIIVHTSSRRTSIDLGGQEIVFKYSAPSKLYWAGRPAMRIVQALLWLRDTGREDSDETLDLIRNHLSEERFGGEIRKDLLDNFHKLPTSWMQDLLRSLIFEGQPDPCGK